MTKQKKGIKEMIDELEAKAQAMREKACALRIIEERYPDATPFEVFDDGAQVTRWESLSAHQDANRLDFTTGGMALNAWEHVLYLEVAGLRLYSARRVDLQEGFRVFCEGGCRGDIIDILRATSDAADQRWKQWKLEREALFERAEQQSSALANG